MRSISGQLTAAALLAVLVVTGCEKRQNPDDDIPFSANIPAPAPPVPDTRPLTDGRILYFLDSALVADSAGIALGATHGAFQYVKEYATAGAGDVHGLRAKVASLLPKLAVAGDDAPQGDLGAVIATQRRKLGALSPLPMGATWDGEYVDSTADYRKTLIETSQRLLDSADSPDLKALIRQMQPVLQKGVDRSKAVEERFLK